MSRLQKFRVPHVLKWVSLLCTQSNFTSSKSNLYVNGLQYFRFCGTESGVNVKNGGNLGENGKLSRVIREEAQAALIEYFHLTSNLKFMDAENMSKNTPEFLDRLLKRVDVDSSEVKSSVARFLRYHPVNEFEPFFESIGLEPCEYVPFLPSNLMFLADDELLLENYYTLCNYGIERNRIGKIYKEAREVFRYDYRVLKSKLQCLQNLGLRQSVVAKIVASSPHLLRGNVDRDFIEFLEKLKKIGIEYDWLEVHISEEDSYNWKCMFQLMCLLCELSLSENQVGEFLKRHPHLLLECSGRITFHLFGLLLKFGLTLYDVQTVFLQFPRISVLKFTCNLCNCYKLLVEIGMDVQDIGRIVRSYPILLGSCELKTVKSLTSLLSCGKSTLCETIKDDPATLKKWVLGVKLTPLEKQERGIKARNLNIQFLLSLGFVEKSKDMERALKAIRGKGVKLQERFDCLVNNGFSREDVIQMVKVSAQLLNQSSDLIETKIRFLVNDLGYQVSDVLAHPKVLSYTIQRLKLRLLMYKWLKDQEAVHPKLCLSTLLSSSEETFVRSYVNSHPKGPEFWKRLNKNIPTDEK